MHKSKRYNKSCGIKYLPHNSLMLDLIVEILARFSCGYVDNFADETIFPKLDESVHSFSSAQLITEYTDFL